MSCTRKDTHFRTVSGWILDLDYLFIYLLFERYLVFQNLGRGQVQLAFFCSQSIWINFGCCRERPQVEFTGNKRETYLATLWWRM